MASLIWSSLFCCCSFKFSAAACLFASILSVRPSDELRVDEAGWDSVPFDLTVTPPLLEDDVTEEDPELFNSEANDDFKDKFILIGRGYK